MNNPLPSGMPLDQVMSSFELSQRLADALAAHDWNTVRSIDVATANETDQALLSGYGNLNRLSLMLLDARPEQNGYQLLMVHVANEHSGAQTTLYCVQWAIDTSANTVRFVITQLAPKIGGVPYAISPEGVRNDPTLDNIARTKCYWAS